MIGLSLLYSKIYLVHYTHFLRFLGMHYAGNLLYGSKFQWDNNFVNFGNALFASKILLPYERVFIPAMNIFQGRVEEFPAVSKWKTFL